MGDDASKEALTETQAVSLALKGDTAQFGFLVKQYQERVIRLSYSFTKNYEDARDVAQEAFIKAYRSLKKFRRDSKFSTWLYRITVNQSRDFLRRRKTPLSTDKHIFEETDNAPAAPHLTIFETRDMLMKLLDQLTWKQRTIVTLAYFEELPNEEIAAILGVSIGTVKATRFQSLAKLKSMMSTGSKEMAL